MNVAELGALVGLAVGVLTLITIAVRVGRSAGRIETVQDTLTADLAAFEHKLTALEQIPIVMQRLVICEERASRNTSDIRELREHAAFTRGRALSRPDIGERGPDED